MRRFVIERDLPGAGTLSGEQLQDVAQTSNAVLRDMGTDVQWEQSYITADRVYCVYRAENEDLVREHAKAAGLPATKVSEVKTVVDPLTANR
jgi:hypothetical protein